MNIDILFLRKKHVYIDKSVRYNRKSEFMGNNKIYRMAVLENVVVGEGTYIAEKSVISNTKIGKYCSIGPDIRIVCGRHPTDKFVSTHPTFFSSSEQAGFTFSKQNVYDEFKYVDNDNRFYVDIGNDVWVGYGVKILDGIRIGDGAVIAAGALVVRDVEPYTIVGGVPAKTIKKRHTQKQIDFLMEFKWWDKDFAWIEKNAYLFTDIEKFCKVNSNNEFVK